MTQGRTATLSELFPETGPEGEALPIAGIAADSRGVAEGFAFVAVPGTKANGAAFIADALARGATAIVGEVERPPTLFPEVPYIRVGDARRALALAAARLHPGQPGTIVAVTGTSGKSSVADFTRQLFAAQGRESASLGTLGIVTSRGADYGSLTTPDPITLHYQLEELAADGVTHLAMEASSHGIEQRRLDGVRLAAAAFTNLGRDHLDYHETLEAYLEAKLRLFRELLAPGLPVVVNMDGAEAARVVDAAAAHGARLVTVGRDGEALRLLDVVRAGFAQRLTVRIARPRGGSHLDLPVDLPLVGGFQAENALVAAGLVMATLPDVDPAEILESLSGLTGVPGRLERVGEVRGALAIVDYAHKPDALEQVLATLRPFASGRLVCVFGCGGDRDRGKRPIMGGIAARGADTVVVTDDNPRSEDPAAIRAEILAAAPGAREIADRGEAIRTAVRGLGPGDVLVVAGKGHETGQIVGDRTLPFSDHDAVRTAIREIAA
ncbi:UDP-N-acetylmuramoyl-L-alanyl-D-glutamate--2,6-diaminopimelate ligase [uncultured Enterovirga sp.]|uniref:UDP-N-acetylmuramoyl-L-alanyl-D-glutamate--2, 6-diaminopimelate ligase n=1 Tax=uncultured Enterovirga sp. TaxID=2026352 RepID=UPI0035CBC652